MPTARRLITRAMLRAGILTKTQAPSADEAADALDTLNDILGMTANDSLMCYARLVESFPLTGNVATYTIGSGQTFDTARPTAIVSAYVRQGNVDYEVVPLRDTSYDRDIGLKTLTGMPEGYFYDNGSPTARITFYPTPDEGYTVYLRMEKPITSFTLDTDVELPPGWNEYLINRLAVTLQPEYGLPADQNIYSFAEQAKAAIKGQVARNRSMDNRPLFPAPFNIYSREGY